MNKLKERINKFLDETYVYEQLWKRSLRFHAILDYIKWNEDKDTKPSIRRNGK